MKECDVAIIGAGPGGYVCAIRAAQLGSKVIVIEKDRIGGICLQSGCIPSKSLIHVSKLYDTARNASRFGIKVDGLAMDYEVLQAWKSDVIRKLEAGIESLLKANKVELIRGTAEIESKDLITVRSASAAEEQVRAKNIVLATGSKPISLPGLEFDGRSVIDSKDALDLKEDPKRLIVVGGGYIGLELASMYQRFGSKIFVVEVLEQLLPGTDIDLVNIVQRKLVKGGAEIHLKSKVVSVERLDGLVRAAVETPQGRISIEAERMLVSVGRRPNLEGVDLARLGVKTDLKGYVQTDERMSTNVQGVYAIGDVRGMPLLAHKASKEGIIAAEVIAGLPSAADWKSIPWAIFTDPEIAGVGLTEEAASHAGFQVKRSRFSFAALGRALASGETDGFVKMVSDAKTGLVLGVQMVGADASNLISEAALAIEMGATVEDVALTIHPHPTLPEAIMEAAEVASGAPIHQVRL